MPSRFPLDPPTRVSDIFFRTMAGLFGGGFGTLIFLIGLLISGTVSSSYLTAVQAGEIHPLFVFITLVLVYLALLVSSLASLTFFYYCDRERYAYLLSSLTHAFALVTLIFIVSTPLSLLLSLGSPESLAIVALILMGLTTIFTVIIMEVVANHQHLLLTLYSSAIALFAFFLVMLVLYLAIGTTTFILPLALPLIWGSFGFWQVAFEMIYQWLYQVYGMDFLNSTRRVGSDYVKEQRLKKA